ncbi:MAG: hypothetical protein GY731_16185 [Gammaproteobacteria bacterium]|nr:hypothetical protein [Gammaproteobacteria bacterium]
MKKYFLTVLFISWFGSGQLTAQNTSQDTLPDDHPLFILQILDGRLEGASEQLEGFKVSMNLPPNILERGLDLSALISLIQNQNITGTLAYPKGGTTQIRYEIVRHRETEEIYMKTTIGYFLWENITIQNDKLSFVVDWWYSPPARTVDLEALKMTEQLLADPAYWHKDDDRRCKDDIKRDQWSLFCALKYASRKKMGEYNHHNTAMHTVRLAIDDLIPDHGFEHPLMDFNNSPATKHADMLRVVKIAKQRVEQKIEKIDK